MSGSLDAALVAGAAAALLGTSSVAQRRGMATTDDGVRGGLLAGLVRSSWWWVGTAASVGGLALQFLALTLGSLIVVQTVLVGGIVATTLAEWFLLGRTPSGIRWAGMILTTTGLITVLLALSPTAGTATRLPSGTALLLLAGTTLVLSAAAARRARRPGTTGIALSVGTGLGYGVTAIALKTVGAELASGWAAPLTHPALWIAVVVGPLSVLLSQHAFRRARAVAAAVSVIVVIDPVVGLAAGVAWFGEHVVVSTDAVVTAMAAAVTVVVGIVTSHSPTPIPDPSPSPSATTAVGDRTLVGSRSSA
ncbi:DMT family transporter [Actinomycetospora endophytica]|uniref:DMT family transporter n=1 Tax=Actinomycetospora endophytica TaxID=2291215 RepID=A0ABS8PD01_9PSEU|nr:DMT family transporter [Actinomycetospora endophytica]MCD2195787.1 DMT family transporter [Actinomycetospora endophytica]